MIHLGSFGASKHQLSFDFDTCVSVLGHAFGDRLLNSRALVCLPYQFMTCKNHQEPRTHRKVQKICVRPCVQVTILIFHHQM